MTRFMCIPTRARTTCRLTWKSSVIGAEITIPVTNHRLNLGTWQGIYFCEFGITADAGRLY